MNTFSDIIRLEEKFPKRINIDSEGKTQNALIGINSMIELCRVVDGEEDMVETPYRVAKAFLEYTQGYEEDPKLHLEKCFNVDHQELILVKNIEFNSMCEHHLAPFFGVAHVAYIPNKKITGLSKIARLVDGYAKRFQVQERLTNQIANAIEEVLDARGVMVVIDSKHYCMCGRGAKKSNASTVTSAVRGVFKEDPATRAEFLSLIK